MKLTNQVFLCAEEAKVDGYQRLVDITLQNGQVYRCSLANSSERLRLAHPSLVEEWEWIGPQAGIHWPAVDEDLSIEYLVDKGALLGDQEFLSQKEGSTAELMQIAMEAGSFDWLDAEEEDAYSLQDGKAVLWPTA